jgi:hypothetical protein
MAALSRFAFALRKLSNLATLGARAGKARRELLLGVRNLEEGQIAD